jgi:hypothetical protein
MKHKHRNEILNVGITIGIGLIIIAIYHNGWLN